MKEATYILLLPRWDRDEWGDYRPSPHWEDEVYFYKDKEFDINKVAKKLGIKKWASHTADPGDYDSWANKDKQDTAMLLQIRPFNIQPITVVSSWGFSSIKEND